MSSVLSLTNIRGVYPKENGVLNRKRVIPHLTWEEYEKMIDAKWIPGAKVPFDPIATKEAKVSRMIVVILSGRNLLNVKNYLEGKSFVGSIIS